jgi:hypothetical protein
METPFPSRQPDRLPLPECGGAVSAGFPEKLLLITRTVNSPLNIPHRTTENFFSGAREAAGNE